MKFIFFVYAFCIFYQICNAQLNTSTFKEVFDNNNSKIEIYTDEEGIIVKYVIPFRKSKDNSNLIIFDLFFDNIEIPTPIDVSSQKTWMRKTLYSINFGKQEDFFVQPECEPIGKETKGILGFSLNILYTNIIFHEFISSETGCDYRATFGLARKSSPKDQSILEQMKSHGASKVFSLEVTNKETFEGMFSIGNLYQKIASYSNKRIDADLLDIGTKWGFTLQGIYIGDINELETNQDNSVFYIKANDSKYRTLKVPVVVETIQNFIIVSDIFVAFLNYQIFSKYINQGICEYKDQIQELHFRGFYCQTKIVESFPNISFVIGNALFVLKTEYLFEKIDTNHVLFIMVSSDLIRRWTFGNIILKHCQIVFDYESSLLRFLFEEKIQTIKIIGQLASSYNPPNSKVTSTEIVQGIIIGISVIGIIILFSSLFLQKIYIDNSSVVFTTTKTKRNKMKK